MRWCDHVIKAAVSLICVVLWNLLLRTVSYCVPTISGEDTYFPRHLINNDDALNRYRLNLSEQLYRQAIKEADHFSPLEIRIIASDRHQNYLIQVIGFLIDSYESHGRLPPSLEICNVEPLVFEELKRFRYRIRIRTIGLASSRQTSLNASIAKEATDYWYCLNHTSKARYVMLLEDDALVVPGFAKLMTSLIDYLDIHKKIDYVKMYHPNHLRKLPSIPMAISTCLLMCYICQVFILRRVLIFWAILTSIPMYMDLRSYGSQFLADVRHYISKSVYLSVTESCCTPAVVFRACRITEIVKKLSKEASRTASVDHAKDHILDESGFVGRQTDTNLVVHIGAISSVRKRRIVLSELLTARAHNR